MTRNTLIWKITNALNEAGALDINNYLNMIDQSNEVHDIIEKELDGIVLVEGSVME